MVWNATCVVDILARSNLPKTSVEAGAAVDTADNYIIDDYILSRY